MQPRDGTCSRSDTLRDGRSKLSPHKTKPGTSRAPIGLQPGTGTNGGEAPIDFTPVFPADTEGFEPTTSPSGGGGAESRKQGYPAFSGAKWIG